MEPAISIKNFSKFFGEIQVVSDLSFDVNQGEIFAFLGGNGSGKTTTVRCLLNIMQPDSGELFLLGKKYTTDLASSVGYLPEERGLYTTSKVLETMIYFGTIKGLSEVTSKKWSLEYLERVGLISKINEKIKKLSSGQQQKIQLGITMINDPKILILDEPTKGLDPVNRELLMAMLEEKNKQGTTVIFITHQMEEVEKIADRLVMIKDGQKILYGDLQEVKNKFGENIIHLEFAGKLVQANKLFTAKIEHNTAEIVPQENVSTEEILRYLLSQELSIRKFNVAAPSLQEIFVKVSKENYE